MNKVVVVVMKSLARLQVWWPSLDHAEIAMPAKQIRKSAILGSGPHVLAREHMSAVRCFC